MIIHCDTSDVARLAYSFKNELSEREIRRGMASALNRTLTHIAAETKKEVKKEYAVSASLNKGVKKKRATAGDLTAEAMYTGATLPIHVFKYKAAANRYRSPVSVMIKKSNGWQTHGGSSPAMFKAYGRKVMLRDGGQRDIRTAHTLSIPQMVSSNEVYSKIAREAEVYLYARLQHELEWRLSQL